MEKIKKVEKPALLTAEEIAKAKITPEELAILEAADAFCDVVDLLPSDEKGMDAFFDKMDKTFPNDFEGAFNKLGEVAQKDPNFYVQLLALTTILNDVVEEEPAKVEKVKTNIIKKAKSNEKIQNILAALKK